MCKPCRLSNLKIMFMILSKTKFYSIIRHPKIGTRYYDQTFFARSIRISSISSIITSTKPCFPFPFSSKKVLICSWKKSRWSSHVFPSVVHIPNFKPIVIDVISDFRYHRQTIKILNFAKNGKNFYLFFLFEKMYQKTCRDVRIALSSPSLLL